MGIRIALGHIDTFDGTVATFARQLGLRSVQLHTPTNLPADGGYWSAEDLTTLRQTCEDAGLALEGLENVPYRHWDHVLWGGPRRDEQLENYCQTVRNIAAAGITLLGYHFMPSYVWRTDVAAPGRGGAIVTAFDEAQIDRGNGLHGHRLAAEPRSRSALSADRLWANHQIFLDTVLPVAESVGVRLALHPDDPPTTRPLGGAARIFSTIDGLKRADEAAAGSPVWGLDLCLGSLSEMPDGASAINEAISHFGPRGRILYVHFRDVQGSVPRFKECFLGEGNYNPATVLRTLADNGFSGFLIDDHVPAMLGDDGTWERIDSRAYCSRGRAHAIGYLQGLLSGLDIS